MNFKSVLSSLSISCAACLLVFAIACERPGNDVPKTYPNAELLLSAEEFAVAMNEANTVVIDTRTSDSAFAASHIPGATWFHSRRDLNDPDHPVEFFLVGAEVFDAQMRALGLHNDTRVLLYDEGNGLGAARMFYALEYFGHEGPIALLNGGFAGWKKAGMETASGSESADRLEGTFTANIRDERMCDIRTVRGAEADPNVIVFDVRSADEYEGTDVRAARGGHIPGAVNLEWSEVLVDGDVPFFRPFEEIEAQYAALGITRDKEVIPHCHTNVRGSHAYFTLRLMGFDSVRPYEGSWSEFGNQ